MGCIGGILYGILQFCALLFVIVGTPLDQFRMKKVSESSVDVQKYFGNNFCLTLWGAKEKCYSTTYISRPRVMFEQCDGRAGWFKATQVCAIVLIAASAAALLLSTLQCCCCKCLKWFILIINVVAVLAGCIVIGGMLNCYLTKAGGDATVPNPCGKLKDFGRDLSLGYEGMMLGAGFILIVVGTGINFINIFIGLIPC